MSENQIDIEKLRRRDRLLSIVRRAFESHNEKRPLKDPEESFMAGMLVGLRLERTMPNDIDFDV